MAFESVYADGEEEGLFVERGGKGGVGVRLPVLWHRVGAWTGAFRDSLLQRFGCGKRASVLGVECVAGQRLSMK